MFRLVNWGEVKIQISDILFLENLRGFFQEPQKKNKISTLPAAARVGTQSSVATQLLQSHLSLFLVSPGMFPAAVWWMTLQISFPYGSILFAFFFFFSRDRDNPTTASWQDLLWLQSSVTNSSTVLEHFLTKNMTLWQMDAYGWQKILFLYIYIYIYIYWNKEWYERNCGGISASSSFCSFVLYVWQNTLNSKP